MEKKLKWPEDFLNIKCVIYTIYIALLYWLLPNKLPINIPPPILKLLRPVPPLLTDNVPD